MGLTGAPALPFLELFFEFGPFQIILHKQYIYINIYCQCSIDISRETILPDLVLELKKIKHTLD